MPTAVSTATRGPKSPRDGGRRTEQRASSGVTGLAADGGRGDGQVGLAQGGFPLPVVQ